MAKYHTKNGGYTHFTHPHPSPPPIYYTNYTPVLENKTEYKRQLPKFHKFERRTKQLCSRSKIQEINKQTKNLKRNYCNKIAKKFNLYCLNPKVLQKRLIPEK